MDLFDKNFIENCELETEDSSDAKIKDLLPIVVLFFLALSYLVPVN